MSWSTWSVYAAVLVVVCATPGPAVFFIVTHGSWRGPRAGVAAVWGIEAANLIYWTLSGLGLAAAISASQAVFTTLKWVGAVYLAWLGLQAIVGSFKEREEVEARRVAGAAFRHGMVVGLSNPKALLFFVTLLPQFIEPARPAAPQVLILAATGVCVELAANTTYALCASALRHALARAKVRRWFDRGIGAVFLSLAGAAALVRRGA